MKGIMQKQNPIDDLFRRGLADYTARPSDERREEFMKDVGTPVKRPLSMWWLAGLRGLIIVGVGTAVILYMGNAAHPVSASSAHRHEVPSSLIVAQRPHPASTGLTLNEKVTGTHPVPSPGTRYPVPSTQTNPVPSTETRYPVPSTQTNPVPSTQTNPVPSTQTNPVPSTETLPANDPKPPSVSRIHDNSSLPKKWNISLGAYYTPEWMFNTLNGDKYVNNMGVEGTFHFGRYSVKTGVGLSITTGWHEVLVQSNPYLGTYQALDSIIFTWDKTQYKLNPTYYTKGTNVYDTSLQYTYTNIKKQYTYLQIPLVLGYDFWQNNWLTLGFRAGAVMSLLLNTQNLSTTYDPGKDRIITINNVTPDRIQMNWQAMGGLNAAFRLSRRFSIELEPDVRYYFNSVYEPSELTKKPWSIGVRTAFVVTF